MRDLPRWDGNVGIAIRPYVGPNDQQLKFRLALKCIDFWTQNNFDYKSSIDVASTMNPELCVVRFSVSWWTHLGASPCFSSIWRRLGHGQNKRLDHWWSSVALSTNLDVCVSPSRRRLFGSTHVKAPGLVWRFFDKIFFLKPFDKLEFFDRRSSN